jgi:hypothetical protein
VDAVTSDRPSKVTPAVRRSSRTTAAWSALAVAALFVATAGWVRVRQLMAARAASRELQGALTDYAECLLGAPLDFHETALSRLRRIEAGLPEGAAESPGGAPSDAWPGRCAVDLDRAHVAFTRHPFLGRRALGQKLDDLIVRARVDPTPAESPDLASDLLAAAAAVGVGATPRPYQPSSPHRAPQPASPLSVRELVPLPVPATSSPDEVMASDADTLRLSFVDLSPPNWTCAFLPLHDEALREARCGEVMRGVVSIARDDLSPRRASLRTQRGRFDRFEVVRPVPDAAPNVTALAPWVQTVAMVDDDLVVVTPHTWYVRPLSPGKEPFGDDVELGDVVGSLAELEVCRTASAVVVGLKTFDTSLGAHKSWRTMAAREAGTWHRTPGQAAVDSGATFTCEGHAGTWTWFERHVATEVDCNADRCESHASLPLTLAWNAGSALYAADLGGRTLLLGLGSTEGPLSGKSVTSVRMRLAPLAAIATAPDVVLFSDSAHDGASVSRASVFVRDGVALALLKGDDPPSYRALRIDAQGDFSAVRVEE